MEQENLERNLTSKQEDFAIFLPALSTFYSLFVGRQRHHEYVNYNRVPSFLKHGVESINWLAPEGLWQYKWSLHSAGHASLDLSDEIFKEDMYRVRNRDTSWLLGDSGGFQIGKGKWEGDWKDPTCPKAGKKRQGVLEWLDAYMDYGMTLDVPAWLSRSPEGMKASKISNYAQTVYGTKVNNDYFMKHRNGNCKFLNVLHGINFAQADDWYEEMKGYCDPKKYPETHFDGWAMGSQNVADLHLSLKRVVTLIFDGLLEKGKHDVMHFLGTSKLESALALTAIQRAVRKNVNENFTVTFDCASPFLATANGQIYIGHRTERDQKWSYMMSPGPDSKSYSTDNRPYDVLCNEFFEGKWMPSPMSQGLKANDICIYGPNDVNKLGNVTKTSWDSFTYAMLMNHNCYIHVNSVQEANRQYDSGNYPNMLVDDTFDKKEVKEVIARIFELSDRDKALALIEDHAKLWIKVVGSGGAIGKKTINASTQYNNLFG